MQLLDEVRVIVRTLRDTGFVFSFANWTDHNELPLTDSRFKRYLIKMCHPFEGTKTIVDLSVRETPDSLSAKLLHIKRSHHGSKNHRSSHCALVELFLAREVTHKSTGKGVAGAGRIKHRLQRISGNREITVGCEERGAVFAT